MRAAILLAVVVTAVPEHAAAAPPRDKSEATALLLSLGSTSLGWAAAFGGVDGDDAEVEGTIAVTGLLLGPSVGRWYAGTALTGGLALRAGGAALMLTGFCPKEPECTNHDGLTHAGLAVFVLGTVWDIVQAPRDARARNRRGLDLTPMVLAVPSGVAPGLGLSTTWP
jgi:hypothetical protein